MLLDSEGDQEGEQRYPPSRSFRHCSDPKTGVGHNDCPVGSNSLPGHPPRQLSSEIFLPCSLSKWPLLNLFLLPATFFMASCHFLKILYQPRRMELTLADFTHFGREINILCMQIVPMRLPTSVEGIVVNCSHYSTWIIIIAPYLALPHKPKRHGSAYLFYTNQQK